MLSLRLTRRGSELRVYGNGSLVPQQGASALPRGLVQAVLVNQSQSKIKGQEPEKTLSLDNAGSGSAVHNIKD